MGRAMLSKSLIQFSADGWDCVFSTASLSHQEASTSLLSLCIRGQTEWKPQSQKTNQTDHVDHILSELSTMSWVALYGMGHSFIELDKVVVHVISLVSFL